MDHSPNISRHVKLVVLIPILVLSGIIRHAGAQTSYAANGSVKTTVSGTSNIHDWEMESARGTCSATLNMDAAGNLTDIGNVSFNMAVNTLKSKHGNQMDNNAYKAMAAEKFPLIKFSGNGGTVKSSGPGSYLLTVPGKLSISSGSRDVTLMASCKVNTDRSVTIDGTYKLNTLDYNVKPISIMLGAIKTSENVTIRYSMTVRAQ